MNVKQYLLTKLAEECSEVAQIALKTQQFGFDEICPGQNLTNSERCYQELDDLFAIVDMLNNLNFGYIENPVAQGNKKSKVLKYLKYSQDLGMVDNEDIEWF